MDLLATIECNSSAVIEAHSEGFKIYFTDFVFLNLPENLRATADMEGVVCLMMVRHPYKGSQGPADAILYTVDYLVTNDGEDVVAIGSDCDGYTVMSKGMTSPRDCGALRSANTEEQTANIFFGNGERLLRLGW